MMLCLDRARSSLRRAQMRLVEMGEIDKAAAVLDERLRLERTLRALEERRASALAAGLIGRGALTSPPDLTLLEPLAEEVLRRAAAVEGGIGRQGRELTRRLNALRLATRRLSTAADEEF